VREWAAAQVAKRGSADYQQASGTVRQSLVRVVNEDLRGLLPHIAAPTLLIWGENDADTPLSDGKMMERLIPDAGLVVFEGAGHYAYLEQPVRFCRIIETFFQS
jgi:pimeloyl-ACP methyl ester carboxylesterase